MAVGPLQVDPSWEVLEGLPPAPAVQPPAHIPPSSGSKPPVPGAAKTRKRLPIWLFAILGLVLVSGILVVLSEYGVLSLGVEQLWGLSNRADQALSVAASTLTNNSNYRVTGKVIVDNLVSSAASGSAPSQLTLEFVQNRSGGVSRTTGNATFHPTAGQEQLLGTLLAPAAPVPFEMIEQNNDLYIRIQQVDGDSQWTKLSAADLTDLGFQSGAGWPTLIQGIAKSLGKGSRLAKQQVENVSTKGYQTQISTSALSASFMKTSVGQADTLDAKAQLGIKDKRPYSVVLAGPIATGTLNANLNATINFSSFGQIEAIVPPTADHVIVRSAASFLSEHGLLKADSVIGRDVQRKADLRTIAVALVEYAASQKPFGYPKVDGTVHLDKASDIAQALAPFLPKLPTDPLAADRYYGYQSDGTSFSLTASLENSGDPAGKHSGSLVLYQVSSQP